MNRFVFSAHRHVAAVAGERHGFGLFVQLFCPYLLAGGGFPQDHVPAFFGPGDDVFAVRRKFGGLYGGYAAFAIFGAFGVAYPHPHFLEVNGSRRCGSGQGRGGLGGVLASGNALALIPAASHQQRRCGKGTHPEQMNWVVV